MNICVPAYAVGAVNHAGAGGGEDSRIRPVAEGGRWRMVGTWRRRRIVGMNGGGSLLQGGSAEDFSDPSVAQLFPRNGNTWDILGQFIEEMGGTIRPSCGNPS
jgi:hypothetical protein